MITQLVNLDTDIDNASKLAMAYKRGKNRLENKRRLATLIDNRPVTTGVASQQWAAGESLYQYVKSIPQ